jgi:integrase/recombinase XerC/integrase/recombinase XerD
MAALKNSAGSLELREITSKFLKYLENVESCSLLTIKAYSLDLEQAFPILSEHIKKPHHISESELLSQARKALVGWGDLSPATRNRKSATLKSFFGYLFREGLIERDLASQVHSPKVPKKIPNFISVDEIIAVLRSFEQDSEKSESKKNEQEKLLFLLLYGAGLRISEACALQWKNMDLRQRVLRIRGKGEKERLVAIPKNLAELLEKAHRNSHEDFVWGAEPLNQRKAYEWIRSRGVKAGLMRPIHPHALRHSFATHLLASGANLRTLQELLGHESLTATEKYTHLGVDQLARTLESHHPFGGKKKESR